MASPTTTIEYDEDQIEYETLLESLVDDASEESVYLNSSGFYVEEEMDGRFSKKTEDNVRQHDDGNSSNPEEVDTSGARDDDSLLQAAALVPLDEQSVDLLQPCQFSRRELLALLIAAVCISIILPTMLAPNLWGYAEPRFPRCGKDEHCMESELCVRDGLDRRTICCPLGLTKTVSIHNTNQLVCGRLTVGARCSDYDSLCGSGYCIGGSCAERPLRRLERCDSDFHCEGTLNCRKRAHNDSTRVCCDVSDGGVCNGMPAGTPCDRSSRCASTLCIFGGCASKKLPDLDECEKADDCQSGNCGSDSVGSARKICCKYFVNVAGANEPVCGNRPVNTFCLDSNEICATGFCINERCAANQLEAGEKCTEPSDCQSNACALKDADTSNSPICCQHSNVVQIYKENRHYLVCGSRPSGTFCGESNGICFSGLCIQNYCADSRLKDFDLCSENDDCMNNVCSLSSPAAESSDHICCPDGSATLLQLQSSFDRTKTCSNMPSGTFCDNIDAICDSGYCINGLCAEDGLEALEVCEEAADCKSKACALNDAKGTQRNVCCESPAIVMGNVLDAGNNKVYRQLCANRPIGTFCNESNDMCASGICINGVCESERRDDLGLCAESSDCKNSACSLAYASTDAPNVCCTDGQTTRGILTDTTWTTTVCAGLSAGSICSNIGSACESGFCINGTCAEQGLSIYEECIESDDCISGVCALQDAYATSTSVCCNGATTVRGELFGGSSYGTVCANQPDGTFCNEINAMCASGLCIDQHCANETLSDFSPCSEDFDCTNGVCALSFANITAPNICCPDGQQTHAYITYLLSGRDYSDYRQICGGMPDGTFCNDIGQMCASGFCNNQLCEPAESLVPSMNPTAF